MFFESDFSKADRDVIIPLKGTQSGLLWSNGSTIDGRYPQQGRYPLGFVEGLENQGNAEDIFFQAIESAKKSLDIYWEEITLSSIASAVIEAVKRGVKVRILLNSITEGSTKIIDLAKDLQKGGAQIYLYDYKILYIHAKMMLVDKADRCSSFVVTGSQNPSFISLYFNRELGLISNNEEVLSLLSQYFECDWASALQGAGVRPSDTSSLQKMQTPSPSQSSVPDTVNSERFFVPLLNGEEIDLNSLSPLILPDSKK